jgi:hypothetical protein
VPAIWKKITRGECRSRLMGHTYEAAGDQSTGIANAVNYYSPRIFQSLGLSAASAKVSADSMGPDTDSQLFATGVYGVVRFVATLIAMVLFKMRGE